MRQGRRVHDGSFNGAATCSLRNAHKFDWPLTRKLTFNGAATCSLRNDGEIHEVLVEGPVLQWGRNMFVAE